LLEWLSEGFRETYCEAKIVCKGEIRGTKKSETSSMREEGGELGMYSEKRKEGEERPRDNLKTDPGQRQREWPKEVMGLFQ
jgi:hypothetical protein